jgi:protein SCO1/2
MSRVARTVTLCLAFVALVVGLFFHSKTRVPVLSDDQLRDLGVFVMPRPRQLSPFALETDDGKPFDASSLEGHWSFLFFGFTHCPDICPTAMAAMGAAERQMQAGGVSDEDQPFAGILVTVDPERDDAATLARYVEGFSPRFIGVRGDREALAAFASEVNVAFAQVPDPSGQSPYQVDHTGNIVIINPRGHYHGFMRMPHKPENIVAAYRTLAATF